MNGKASRQRSDDFAKRKRTHVPYAVMMLDQDFRVCGYCEEAGALFGFSGLSTIGKSVEQILPGLQAHLAQRAAPEPGRQSLMVFETDVQNASGKSIPIAVGVREDHSHGRCRHLVLVRNLAQPEGHLSHADTDVSR